MFGPDVNGLYVFLKRNNQMGAPVWSRIRNQGNNWLRGEVRIRGISDAYQIIIEAVSGAYSSGVSVFGLK